MGKSFDDLEAVWGEWRTAPQFDRLRHYATQLVPGAGCATSPLAAFVGEAPGRDEDAQGRPFVGPSGRVLRDMMGRWGFDESNCWITNVVKYRPVRNRTPTWAERTAARPLLKQEMRLVRPRVIVLLGAVATSLIVAQPITRVHGQPYGIRGWIYLPMFHPAYLLRSDDITREKAEQDMAKLVRLTGRDLLEATT